MQTDTNEKFIPGKTRIKYGGAYTDEKDFEAIQSVLDRNWWTIDEHARQLEKEISDFTEHKHTILTNSGSSALLVGFGALSYPEGSEVITGAVHFPTAISSLYYNRLTPVFIDNEEQTLGLDPNLIEKAITDRTKSILTVAIAGSIPYIHEIIEIAKKHNLDVILDNCDGFGGMLNGIPIDKYFTLACTSYHAAHIMTMGEGGAVMTSNQEIAEKVRSLKEWGRVGDTDDTTQFEDIPEDYPGRYIFKYMGFNMKPLELQCAMGRTQLQKLEEIRDLRQKNYNILYRGLFGIDEVQLMKTIPGAQPSWFSFPLFAKDRANLRGFLENRQIETRTIFGGNITKQPAFKDFGRIATPLPVADRVMTEGMFVSVHPNNTPEMMDYIVKSIREYYGRE